MYRTVMMVVYAGPDEDGDLRVEVDLTGGYEALGVSEAAQVAHQAHLLLARIFASAADDYDDARAAQDEAEAEADPEPVAVVWRN